jgi:transcriptional activator/NB-ARC domain-containing protein
VRAEALIRPGGRSEDHVNAVARLRTALELWRGPALSDVSGPTWLDEQAARLEELRTEGTQSLMDARLALGEHARLLPELERLVQLHPFREQFHRQLMLALYRSGRQADALAAYRRLRRSLKVELGVDPSSALRDLEAAILRQDAGLDPSPTPVISPAPPARRSHAQQLPLAAHTFTGRRAELTRLDGLASVDGVAADTVTIVVISGTPGVGKTALAIHWAHRVASRFPDGQLYVNLRGFDPAGAAMTPGEAIRGFLSALQVPAEQIPVSLDAQATLLRSVLATKRVLMVLDNARDEEQVRPLLPGTPGSVVVVTSRYRLGGLVATEGARALPLRLPATAEAREMLSRRLGAERVAADAEAIDDIIASCAHLPLALAVAAAHPAAAPEFPLAYLASRLRDATAALDPFHNADKATDVRAVFSSSYQALSPAAARLFRYLGLCPGPDISVAAAASLAGLPPHEIQPLLAELVLMHLLTEATPGRYSYHDLLRAYAMEQAHSLDSPEQRANALHRMLDHYLHTAHPAALLLLTNREPIALDEIQPGVTITDLADEQQAAAWFETEQALLYAAIELAPDTADPGRHPRRPERPPHRRELALRPLAKPQARESRRRPTRVKYGQNGPSGNERPASVHIPHRKVAWRETVGQRGGPPGIRTPNLRIARG